VAARLTGPRLTARHPGPGRVAADLVTGEGVDAALPGIDTVINCATVRGVRFPGRIAAAVRAGGLRCLDRAVGTTTFAEHLERGGGALRIEIFPADLDATAAF
jgi:hypothetical protein